MLAHGPSMNARSCLPSQSIRPNALPTPAPPRQRAWIAQRPPPAEEGSKSPDRGGPARQLGLEERLRVKRCVGRSGNRHDLIETYVELLGQQSRFRGVDTLTHLDARHHQRYASLVRDADETADCARSCRFGRRGSCSGARGEGDHETAYDQLATGNRQAPGHVREADLIAARMRA